MARYKELPHVATSPLLRYTFVAAFLSSSILAAWLVRIRPIVNGQPVDFEENLAQGLLQFPPNARPPIHIRQHYTGIEGIDVVFRTLVAAFIAGPARLEARIWLQQFHFLLGFAPMMAISLIESCRSCWKGNLLIGTTWVRGILYQTVAGALAMPWYQAAYIWSSIYSDVDRDTPDRSILSFNQELDRLSAKAIIPTVMLGYVLPTLVMYLVPFSDMSLLMAVVAYWMITPVFLDPLMLTIKLLLAPTGYMKGPEYTALGRPDTAYLYPLYAMLTSVAGASHLYTLYVIFASSSPWTMLSITFVPSKTDAMSSTFAGFHNIFQWDWIFVATQQVLWTLYAIYDLKVAGAATANGIVATAAVLLATLVLGPGGLLALTWWWRETRLVGLAASQQAEKEMKRR